MKFFIKKWRFKKNNTIRTWDIHQRFQKCIIFWELRTYLDHIKCICFHLVLFLLNQIFYDYILRIRELLKIIYLKKKLYSQCNKKRNEAPHSLVYDSKFFVLNRQRIHISEIILHMIWICLCFRLKYVTMWQSK